MEHLFRLKQRKTNIKTEMAAGLATYCSMIYVVSVIVSMMVSTGMQETEVFASVLLASGIGSIIMGLLANYPVALAPSLGVTALFSTTICGRMGYSWQAGLCAVFFAGILFFILAVTGIRKSILASIPAHLKHAISGGIGCFLTFIGLKNSAIIISDKQTLVTLGKIYDPEVFVTLFGIVILLLLGIRQKKFPILKGMAATVAVGLVMGIFSDSEGLPRFSAELPLIPDSVTNFGAFADGFSELFSSINVIVIFISILFVDFFDTTGTLIAVISRSKLPTVDGEPENLNRALMADALGSVVGAVLGASSVSSYIESEAGIATGGRTGLTAVTTGILFLLTVFLYPIFGLMTECVTSPILIFVGSTMIQQFAKIDWKDYVEGISGFSTVIMMILTYSIADGIAFGFIIYGLTSLFSGRYKEVSPLMWGMIGMFCIYFLMI